MLDHALALYTQDPAATRDLLHEHASTLLQVLHPWPQARLEPDAVVWQADVDQLAAAAAQRGHAIRAELQAQVAHARALATLFGADTVAPGGVHVPGPVGVHRERS